MPVSVRIEQEPAYVIHRRRYRETSLILELLTCDHGRVGVVARGARRATSRLRGVLQPFGPLSVSWLGRGELGTLTQAEPHGPSASLRGARLVSGLYLNELVYRLCGRYDPHPALFSAYVDAVSGLARPEPYEAALRVFEKRLLEAIGYGLVLHRTADTQAPLEPARSYTYVLEQGPIASEGGAVRGPYPTVSGATLLALANETLLGDSVLAEAKQLMRSVLVPYLGGRPLASREILAGPRAGPEGRRPAPSPG